MYEENKIQEILETQQKILGKIENILVQQGRFESDVESEKRTRADRNRGFDEQIRRLDDLIYNRDTGLAFEIDRLKIRDKEREKKQDENKKWTIGLVTTVAGLLIKLLFDLYKT